jgi:hypothetical protein
VQQGFLKARKEEKKTKAKGRLPIPVQENYNHLFHSS